MSDPRSAAPSSGSGVLRSELHGMVCVLRPTASLQAATVQDIADAAEGQIGNRCLVVVDLTSVNLIDGGGLEWLLDLDDTLAHRGGCLRLAAAGDLCRDMLRITGVGERLATFDSLGDALADLAS